MGVRGRVQDKSADHQTPARRIRADAQRNEEAIVKAAKEIFMALGVDAPVRDVAARAGVGIGTLYRRFPNRADLVAAVFRREVDLCAAEAARLGAQHPPGEALAHWLRRYSTFLATKKGLAAALHSGDPAFGALPDYFRSSFEPALARLMQAAIDSGEITASVEPYDLLRAIGNLATASGEGSREHLDRMLDLIMNGLRYGAPAS